MKQNPEHSEDTQVIDFLLNESIQDSATPRDPKSNQPDSVEAEIFQETKSAIAQIHQYYLNERHPMHDLTMDQKTELYSSFTEVFPKRSSSNWLDGFLRLRIAFLAGFAAMAVIASVPLIHWIATPRGPQNIPGNIEGNFTIPAPEIVEYTPPPKKIKKQEDPEVELTLRPTVEEIEYSLLPMDGAGISINSSPVGIGEIHIEDDIVSILDADVIPRATAKYPPVYPPEKKRNRIPGRVLVEFIVGTNGRVMNPVAVESTHRDFERAAIEAIRKWRFEPGQKDGEVVKIKMRMPFIFNMKN